jgi:hypothetical protein
MLLLQDIDLTTDKTAACYVKTEIVDVRFALADGELISLEGPNHYRAGDALITGATGSHWSVVQTRFHDKYEAVPPTQTNQDGRYRAKPVPVLAKQIMEPFTALRSAGGDQLNGKTGDWLLQYGPGDFGVAENNRFVQVYRKLA